MSSQTEHSISDSLETNPSMLPYMPYLLQDLWALGSSIEIILDVIDQLKLPRDTKILDLGCGKGAVSVQIASKFGYEVTGVDAMEPFLRDAIQKANEYKVSHLCEFVHQDILQYTLKNHMYDVVILAAVGPVFGSLKDTVAGLRTQIKNEGYIIIDDGYLKNGDHLTRKGYEHCKNHDESIKDLTSFGDELLQEISTDELSIKINEEYTASIKRRGKELIASNPGLKNEINNYILAQEEECRILENEIGGAVWLLRKKE
jgi:SAM-dependent methyltransferase